MMCSHPRCPASTTDLCEHCDQAFCEEHGSAGGDRESEGGLVAIPSQCWRCSGMDEDGNMVQPRA